MIKFIPVNHVCRLRGRNVVSDINGLMFSRVFLGCRSSHGAIECFYPHGTWHNDWKQEGLDSLIGQSNFGGKK